MKKILYFLILAALAGGLYAYYQYNKPVAGMESQKVDVLIKSADLLKAFEGDEAAANAKYLDKVIEVEGEVSKVEKNTEKSSVYLKTTNEMSSVICEFENGNDLADIKEGSNIKIKGKCTGYLMDVVLVQAVVSK